LAPGENGATRVPPNVGGGGSGGVSVTTNRIPEADYYRGIQKIAGPDVNVTYLETVWDNNDDPGIYDALTFAKTSPNGEAGLSLDVEITGNNTAAIKATVQKGINLAWPVGQLPFGVPAGKDAAFTYSGVLESPKTVDLALRVTGNPIITLGGRKILNDALIHLSRNTPVSIEIKVVALANPPPGGGFQRATGRYASNGHELRIGFAQPQLHDPEGRLKKADAVVVCIGLNRTVESEGADRGFDLLQSQRLLAYAAAGLNPRTIVINNSGAAVGVSEWIDRAAAVMQAYYLGQEGGLAIGRLLFGDVNPSGRLVSSWDRSLEDCPAWPNYPGHPEGGATYPSVHYDEGIFVGYRGYDRAGKQPLFPFGYGLSYTTFEYSHLKAVPADTNVIVSLNVKNTGQRTGTDVVQVYVGEKSCPLPRPLRELKGFHRATLDPGETQRVEITLPADAFAYYDPAKHDWTADAGHTFTIEVGQSEHDIKLTDKIVYR
jgi:hypothetical protein